MKLEEKENLKKRAATGAVLLVGKRVVTQAIGTLSNIFLARLLFPSDFGTFAIVTFVVIFFTVFSDLGLGPSLVQKKEDLDQKDLQTAFTFQLFLIFAIVLFIFLGAPIIAGFYNLGQTGVNLLRFYSLYLFILPIKTTCGALLERNLEYKKLVTIEVTEIGITSITTVILAFLGFGVFSFVFSSVFGHFVGGLLYFIFSPWKLRLLISGKNLVKLAKFGLPFQSQAWFGLFYGPAILLYLGKAVGAQNLGFYIFAASLSVFPLAASEIINRIVFPLGARTQKDKLFFRQLIERSLVIVSATSLPIVAFMLVTAPALIHFIYTDRWTPALPAIYLGLVQMGIISYTGVFTQLLLSLGKANVMRNISAVWALVTWILGPALIYYFNFVGMSLTGLLVSATGLWLLVRLKQEVNFSWLPNFAPFFGSSAIAGFVVFIAIRTLPGNILGLVLGLFLGGAVYLGLVLLLKGRELVDNFRVLILAFGKG